MSPGPSTRIGVLPDKERLRQRIAKGTLKWEHRILIGFEHILTDERTCRGSPPTTVNWHKDSTIREAMMFSCGTIKGECVE